MKLNLVLLLFVALLFGCAKEEALSTTSTTLKFSADGIEYIALVGYTAANTENLDGLKRHSPLLIFKEGTSDIGVGVYDETQYRVMKGSELLGTFSPNQIVLYDEKAKSLRILSTDFSIESLLDTDSFEKTVITLLESN